MSVTNNRWWEFYFIRYLVGTVVGAVIILFLNTAEPSMFEDLILPGVTNASKLDGEKIWLLISLGFAYCYVASAPILVIHAARGVLFCSNNLRVFVYSLVCSLMAVVAIGIYYRCIKSPVYIDEVLAVTAFALIIINQFILLVFSLIKRSELAHNYYMRLSKARSNNTVEAAQYMESYKHIREHGNAFFIVFCEAVLALILMSLPDMPSIYFVLILWVVPASMVWLLGTFLENRFAHENI